MAGTEIRSVLTEERDTSPRSSTMETTAQLNKAIADMATLRKALLTLLRNQVIGITTASLSVDANAEDVETDNAITLLIEGVNVAFAAQGAIDLSTKSINAKTIATSAAGAAWVYGKYDGTTDAQQAVNASSQTTAIAALAQYAVATNTLPPAAGMAPIGVVQVTEGGSGTFTWGTDSITAETETYYDLLKVPGVITPIATLALTAGAATWAYGAGVVRLGSNTVVSLTGKTGVTLTGATVIATGATGAWLIYALADDVEYTLQLGAAYANLKAARLAVEDHNVNPLLPVIGVLYVENNSGADFTPGTTALDLTGVTATFEIASSITGTINASTDLTAALVANLEGVTLA